MINQISHTKLDTYKQCGYKFYLKYIERWEEKETAAALLFGSSLDKALNYILESIKDKKNYTIKKAQAVFEKEMKKWDLNKPLSFFKSEAPENIKDYPEGEQQMVVFNHLLKMGKMMIETYHKEVIPLIDEVIDVQIQKHIKNADGDTLIIVLDFIAKLKDGRTVIFDNKTSSKPYPKNSVETSQQLALYSEFFDYKNSGYIVMIKDLSKDQIKWHYLVGEVSEEKKTEVFNELETLMGDMKQGKFDKNYKSCYLYGKKCPYYSICQFGNTQGYNKKK